MLHELFICFISHSNFQLTLLSYFHAGGSGATTLPGGSGATTPRMLRIPTTPPGAPKKEEKEQRSRRECFGEPFCVDARRENGSGAVQCDQEVEEKRGLG